MKNSYLHFWLLLAAASCAPAQQYIASTIAGGGPPATPVAAASASIGQPQRVSVDSAGNVYFTSLNTVFKRDTQGVLTVVAGNGRAGFAGDGGPAASAQFNQPKGLCIDSTGDIFIADSGNNRVREVTPDGMIQTVAGIGSPGYTGDTGPALGAQLNLPSAVAVDSAGSLYIADTANYVVRKVDTNGLINTVAGIGSLGYTGDGGSPAAAQLSGIEDIFVDAKGNMYLADTGNAAIRMASPNTGVISTVAGIGAPGYSGDGGAATSAQLNQPFGVVLDGSGNIYILENGGSRIRKVAGGKISTIAGTGTAGYSGDGSAASKAQFNLPSGIAIDSSGNLYIADQFNLRIREIGSSGNISTIAGSGLGSFSGDGGPAFQAQLSGPAGVAVDAAGNIYISDTRNARVRQISPSGVISTVAGNGTPGYAGDGGSAVNAQLDNPQGLAVDAAGNLYIADYSNNRVRIVSNGVINTYAGNGSSGLSGDNGPAVNAEVSEPQGLAMDASGNLYIAAFGSSTIRKVNASGVITTIAGNGFAAYSGDGGVPTNAALHQPKGVAVDSAGNVYIADTGNNRVRVVANGVINTIAGSGIPGSGGDGSGAASAQLAAPTSVAVDNSGDVFVADGGTRIRKIFPAGTITTVAGTGIAGYSGDGGPALAAQFSNLSQIAMTASGSLYLADSGNNAVRQIQPAANGIAINAVVNAASNQTGPVAPGEVVVLYGTGLGPSQLTGYQLTPDGLVSTSASGTSIYFNTTPAPILYTSAGQVAAVVPFASAGSVVQIAAQYNGQTSSPVTIPLAQASPAIFTVSPAGFGQAAALNPDGSPNIPANPASVGDIVTFFVTGAGLTSPASIDGQINASPFPAPVLGVSATIGGQPALVQFAGGAPGLVAGLTQVNLQIPGGIATGDTVPVVLQIGNVPGPAVTIAVR